MYTEPKSRHADAELSSKDLILIIPMGFSALLGFALSFTLFQPDGRPYLFGGCLIVFFVSLLFADRKRDIFLGCIGFLLIRLVWAAVVTALRATGPQ
jgi:FtsH-binding integral membrane protein